MGADDSAALEVAAVSGFFVCALIGVQFAIAPCSDQNVDDPIASRCVVGKRQGISEEAIYTWRKGFFQTRSGAESARGRECATQETG